MSKAYFYKELFSSPFYIGGRVVPFIGIGEDEGVLETDNEEVIRALKNAAHKHVGGIVEIDELTYESKKKLPVKQWVKQQPRLSASQDKGNPPAAMLKRDSLAMDQGGGLNVPAALVTNKQSAAARVNSIGELRPKSRKVGDISKVVEDLGL